MILCGSQDEAEAESSVFSILKIVRNKKAGNKKVFFLSAWLGILANKIIFVWGSIIFRFYFFLSTRQVKQNAQLLHPPTPNGQYHNITVCSPPQKCYHPQFTLHNFPTRSLKNILIKSYKHHSKFFKYYFLNASFVHSNK